jgi:hypothetical protein
MAKKPIKEATVTPVVGEEDLFMKITEITNITITQNASASPVPEEQGLVTPTGDGVLKTRH